MYVIVLLFITIIIIYKKYISYLPLYSNSTVTVYNKVH